MTTPDWMPTSVGIDAPRWATRPGCRSVLVVVHTLVACHRLMDAVDAIEEDPRLQLVFTVAPDAFNHTVAPHLRELGALVVPWEQAVRERFDLAVAAAYGGLHQLHAPLVVMAHGAGHGKVVRPPDEGGPVCADPPVYGLDEQRLVRNGRVLPSALLLSTDRELGVLGRQCPLALPVAEVVGDPCLDRLLASLPSRARYRRALGVSDRHRLVVVSSTWGPGGLFGNSPDLLPRLMTELPGDRYRVGALLHPAVWAAHGARQVRAWLRDSRAAGLLLLDPTDDWRALVASADHLVGDHGSVTCYGAAAGVPLLHLPPADPSVTAPGTAQALVASRARRFDPGLPVEEQLLAASRVPRRAVVSALSSHPGGSQQRVRRVLYRLLGLPEPGLHRGAPPVPRPRSARTAAA